MLKAITTQKLRARIGEYIDRANLTGDAFVLLRDGRAKAVLLGAKQYHDLLELVNQNVPDAPVSGRNEDQDAKPVSLQELKKLLS
jgi:PHD/YefM family antitoxin component YafN of YafNO toxin-antitoxin module